MEEALKTIVSFVSILGNQNEFVKNLENTIATNATGFSIMHENPTCFSEPAEDAALLFPGLAKKYGYPAEEYSVITEDGYKLKVFRIPGRRQALPILLFHGVLDSSDTWLIRGEESLGITLARMGHDVWFGNTRGNRYSQGHVSSEVELNRARYYNYTFDEHGKYDLAATIDFILHKTGAKKLNSIGHSQGTTMNFILCSSRPEYNEKINLFIALAPVAFLNTNPPPVSTLIRNADALYKIAQKLKIYALFEEDSPINAALRKVCPQPIIGYAVCALDIFFPFFGFDIEEFGPCFLRTEIGHVPTASSVKNLYHFAQLGMRKRFAPYDYGRAGNIAEYGTEAPPDYDLGKITTRVALLVGMNDNLSRVTDALMIKRGLANLVAFKIIPRAICNHVDFIFGKNMQEYLYPSIFEVLHWYGRH